VPVTVSQVWLDVAVKLTADASELFTLTKSLPESPIVRVVGETINVAGAGGAAHPGAAISIEITKRRAAILSSF
jgi:hypothetical protein